MPSLPVIGTCEGGGPGTSWLAAYTCGGFNLTLQSGDRAAWNFRSKNGNLYRINTPAWTGRPAVDLRAALKDFAETHVEELLARMDQLRRQELPGIWAGCLVVNLDALRYCREALATLPKGP